MLVPPMFPRQWSCMSLQDKALRGIDHLVENGISSTLKNYKMEALLGEVIISAGRTTSYGHHIYGAHIAFSLCLAWKHELLRSTHRAAHCGPCAKPVGIASARCDVSLICGF